MPKPSQPDAPWHRTRPRAVRRLTIDNPLPSRWSWTRDRHLYLVDPRGRRWRVRVNAAGWALRKEATDAATVP